MVDSREGKRIGGESRRVMEALVETIIPSEGPDRPGAVETDLVDRLLVWLGQIPGSPAWLFVLACWMWEFSPLWSGRFSRLSRLSLEERTRLLEGWESSRLLIRRWPFFLTKVLILAAFYSNQEIWPLIGYEQGCLSEPQNPIEDQV